MRRRCWKSWEFLGPIFFVSGILKRGEWGPTWGLISILLCGFLRFLKVLHGYLANTTDPVAPPSLRGMFGLQVDVDSMILSCSSRGDMDSAFPGGFAGKNIYVIHGCFFFWPCQHVAWNHPIGSTHLLVSEVCLALAKIL